MKKLFFISLLALSSMFSIAQDSGEVVQDNSLLDSVNVGDLPEDGVIVDDEPGDSVNVGDLPDDGVVAEDEPGEGGGIEVPLWVFLISVLLNALMLFIKSKDAGFINKSVELLQTVADSLKDGNLSTSEIQGIAAKAKLLVGKKK